MSDRKNLEELHAQVTSDIVASRTQEMAELKAENQAAAKAGAARQDSALGPLAKSLGMDVSQLEKQIAESSAQGQSQFEASEARMTKESRAPASATGLVDFDAHILPAGVERLTPSWTAAFSSDDDLSSLTKASVIAPRDLVSGGTTQDYSNWASGGGWGCLGSGVGKIQSWVEFGFWYYVPASRFYSIRPMFRYRGFYIVHADDGFWDCKSAQTVISAWVNVYQYNWKGWNAINVLDVSGDNIDVNKRFDDDRYTYNSYLLGGGDWAWIRCTIGLYARAQGGGSNVKNDFATGNANYLSVPWAYIF